MKELLKALRCLTVLLVIIAIRKNKKEQSERVQIGSVSLVWSGSVSSPTEIQIVWHLQIGGKIVEISIRDKKNVFVSDSCNR